MIYLSNVLIISKPVEIDINELKEFPEQDIFPPMSKSQMELLKESIQKDGIYHPLLVADKGIIHSELYTILSGHNRWKAAIELNLKEIPCRIISFSPEGESLPKEIKYRILKEIFLDSNLAQRILDPETYLKCLSQREANVVRSNHSSLKASLIPELAEALEEGKLDVPLARALAKIPYEKQKDFIHLIGEKIKYVANIKLVKLEEILRETQKQLNRKVEEYKQVVQQLEEHKKLLEQYNKQNERLINERKKVEEEKEKLISRIKQLEAEKEILLSRPDPTPDEALEKLDKKITNLKNKLWEKDQKLEELQELLIQTESQAKRLEEMLSKERAEKERLKAEMTARIQEEVKKVREEQKQQTFSPDNIPKGLEIALLARRLTEWLNSLFTETWAMGDQFDSRARKFILDALEELSLAIELAREKMKGKDILFEEMKKLDPEVF